MLKKTNCVIAIGKKLCYTANGALSYCCGQSAVWAGIPADSTVHCFIQKMLKHAPDIKMKEVFPMNNKYEAPVAEVIDFEKDYVLAALSGQGRLESPI